MRDRASRHRPRQDDHTNAGIREHGEFSVNVSRTRGCAWCSPDCLTVGKPDIAKIRPFTLSMPDNRYRAVGAQIGKAWSDGKGFGKVCICT